MDAVHAKYIKQWEEKNPGWKVAPEVVGWAQCQDKATTLAAAGTPVAMAYVGSRTLKEFAQNDLIVPGADDGRGKEELLSATSSTR